MLSIFIISKKNTFTVNGLSTFQGTFISLFLSYPHKNLVGQIRTKPIQVIYPKKTRKTSARY